MKIAAILTRLARALLLLPGALLPSLPAAAQDFSHDGNRWYEVELIIFTNDPLGASQERAIPGRTVLEYPSRLVSLTPAGASFAVDFSVLTPVPPPAQPSRGGIGTAGAAADPLAPAGTEPVFGPRFNPAAARAFRLTDFARDAFVALGPEQRKLGQAARRLANAAGHRVLYHQAWRQPGMSRAQAQAVFVRGGERYGEHDELEGSVLLTYVPNGVNLDLNLWLAGFRAAGLRGAAESPWELPPQPFPAQPEVLPAPSPAPSGFPRAAMAGTPRYTVAEVARLRQSRNLGLGPLHYFDHPAFGVLVQVRPYVLPLPGGFAAE